MPEWDYRLRVRLKNISFCAVLRKLSIYLQFSILNSQLIQLLFDIQLRSNVQIESVLSEFLTHKAPK
jgi:hypothetical protein